MGRDMAAEDPGVRHGRWVVTGYGGRNKRGDIMLACECDCGTCKTIRKEALTNGQSKSCGCLRTEISKKRNTKHGRSEAAFLGHYRSYKGGASRRNLQFDLTEEEFILLSSKNCSYCGCDPIEFRSKRVGENKLSGYVANGIDRMDNRRGYSKDNVVTCCPTCNGMKSKMGRSDFIEMCKSIALHNN
jgi:hypothetical protein